MTSRSRGLLLFLSFAVPCPTQIGLGLLSLAGISRAARVAPETVPVSGSDATTIQVPPPAQTGGGVTSPGPTQPEGGELVPGVPIERALAPGETHSYRIMFAAGQYVHVVVDQRGIDVVVSLFAPDGRPLVTMDSPNGVIGPETVHVVAEVPGDYRLQVRAFDNGAGPGMYQVEIKEQREATGQDESRATGEEALLEGRRYLGDQNPEALEKLQDALMLFRAIGDRGREADTMIEIGGAHQVMGDSKAALDSFNHALGLVKGDGFREASAQMGLGGVYLGLADLEKALACYGRALSLFQSLGRPDGEGCMMSFIGRIFIASGHTRKALEASEQGQVLSRATRNPYCEAMALENIGDVHWLSRDPEKALEHYNQALLIYREWGKPHPQFIEIMNIGRAYHLLGEYQKALDSLGQALSFFKTSGERELEAQTLSAIGEVYSTLGQPQEAMEYFGQGLHLWRAVGGRLGEAATLAGMARVERDTGRLSEARTHWEAALSIVESVRTAVPAGDLRATYLASKHDFYVEYTDLLMRLHRQQPSAGHDEPALGATERARARNLLEILTEARVDVRQGVDPTLLERERELQEQLNFKEQDRMKLLSRKHTEEEAAAAERELADLETEYEQVRAEIRARSPHYAALTQPQPLSLQDIQSQVLDGETLLLEYALGEERSYLWAVAPEWMESYELPGRKEIEAAAREVYETIQRRSRGLPESLEKLSRMVLGPVAGRLERKRLVIVADGALQYVPFGALPELGERGAEGQVPLIVNHEIVSLPSASVLGVMRREAGDRRPAEKAVAVLADPVFDAADPRVRRKSAAQDRNVGKGPQGKTPGAVGREPGMGKMAEDELTRSAGQVGISEFARLPGSRQEAELIVGMGPGGRNLKAVDFAASKATALGSELGKYRVVHFATHGLVNSVHPGLSGLVLSLVDEQGEAQDGFLRLHDIYNMELGADLAVLSACRTALGKQVRGEGLVGLTRGFMYAGAPRVVASLWDVNDAATARLMKEFYDGMLNRGQRAAGALREAQVRMWRERRWRSPYYWAGFVFQGEWR